jgi:hypothetical protein
MKTGPGVVAAVFAGVLVLAGGLGFLLYEAGGGASPDGSLEPATAPDKPGAARRVHAEEPIVAPPVEPPPHERPNVAKPIPKEGRLRFEFEGHPDLALRDWADAAAAVRGMSETFAEVAEKGPPSPEDKARLERDQKRAMRLQAAVFQRPPGSSEGAALTPLDHPAFAANLIAATLDADKLPLTEAQARRLVDLAKERGPVYDQAVAAVETPDPAAWTIELLAARANVLESFFGEVYATLTAAQAQSLVHDTFRNRLRADFLSAAGAWGYIAQPLPFAQDDQLVDTIATGLSNQFGVVDRKEEVRAIVAAWVKANPPETPDALDRRGFLRTQLVARAAPRMVELLKQLVDGLKLPEETAAEMRKVQRAYIPIRK